MKMKCMLLAAVVLAFAGTGCQKQTDVATPDQTATAKTTGTDDVGAPAAPCTPGYYQLALDPSTGQSLIYKVSGSPSAGPVIVTPINGSAGNNIIGFSSFPGGILKMTGLSYDPTTNTCWGTTSSGGAAATQHKLVKFSLADPNIASVTPLVAGCLPLDISDIERDFTTGAYYAINRAASPNARVVKVSVPGGVVGCLPNALGAGVSPRGLTFNCNAQLYVMHMAGTSGKLLDVNKATGLITASYGYPGIIAPGAPAASAPEMGLHFDCSCIGRFITGNFDPTTNILHTDGLPLGLGGPLYASLPGTLKPTVDFARP